MQHVSEAQQQSMNDSMQALELKGDETLQQLKACKRSLKSLIIKNYGGMPDSSFIIPEKVTQQRVNQERRTTHLATQKVHNKVEAMLFLIKDLPSLMASAQCHGWRHAVLSSRQEHHDQDVEDERSKRKTASDEQRAVKAKRSRPTIGIITAASFDVSDEDDDLSSRVY